MADLTKFAEFETTEKPTKDKKKPVASLDDFSDFEVGADEFGLENRGITDANKGANTHAAKRFEVLDNVIKQRKSALANLGETISNATKIQNPPDRFGGAIGAAIQGGEQSPAIQAAKFALPIADLYGQLSESPGANVLLQALRKPKETLLDFSIAGFGSNSVAKAAQRGITGEERGEYGDVLRAAGVPEGIAKTGGLTAAILLDPFQLKQFTTAKGISKLGDFIRGIARKKAKKGIRKVLFERGGKTVEKKVFKRNLNQIASDLKDTITNKYTDDVKKVNLESGIEGISARRKLLIDSQADFAAKLEADKVLLSRQMNKFNKPIKVRTTLKDFFGKNSKLYKKRIDDISQFMDESGQGFSMEDMNKVINDTLDNAQVNGLAEDSVFKRLKGLGKKYSSDLDIGFKEMFNDYKAVRDSGEIGNAVSSSFSKKWVDTAKDISPEFKLLQQQYAPILQMKEFSDKTFKLFGNKFDTASIERFLIKAQKGKLTTGETNLLVELAKDNPGFSKGIENLVDNSMTLQRETARRAKEASIINKEFERQINRLDKALGKKSPQALKRKIELKAQLVRRTKEIERRTREGKIILSKGKRFSQNRNWIQGIGASILIYELMTRPIRGGMYKLTHGE